MTYIYCLKDGDRIYYIGKTIDIQRRKQAHIRKSFQLLDMKDIIIQKQLKEGNGIGFHILETCEDFAAPVKERQWITEMSLKGHPLSNVIHLGVFTKIEYKILILIATGYSSKEIAKIRNRSLKTIEAIRYSMFKKFKVKSAAHLVYWAIKNNILST